MRRCRITCRCVLSLGRGRSGLPVHNRAGLAWPYAALRAELPSLPIALGSRCRRKKRPLVETELRAQCSWLVLSERGS